MRFFSQLISSIILLGILSIMGCQEESREIIGPSPTESITKESKSGVFLNRISQKDGSEDNIVDGGSCTTILFPFTVTVNETTLEINSEEDYDLIEDIIDEFETDQDTVIIQFPIQVQLPDHSVITVNNLDQLEDLIDDCIEDGFDDDIECIDIIYPISFAVFNQTTQQASTVTITDDNELYEFIDEIEDEDVISLNYPIRLQLFSGDIITVQNNEQFEAAIEEYEDSCDEDDDNDFDDDDVDDTQLKNTLLSGTWIIEEYDSASMDLTNLFIGFDIQFLANDLLMAADDNEEIEGEWRTNGNDGFLELVLEFDTDGDLRLLNKDWKVTNFSQNTINLINQDPETPIILTLIIK